MRVIEKVKGLFKKTEEHKCTECNCANKKATEEIVIRIVPDRRDVNYAKLMPTTDVAQALYDYIYNKYMFHMSKYQRDLAEMYRALLIEIKQISEKNWHKIKC